MSFGEDCPICQERNSVKCWRKESEDNKVHYFFKCDKCKREWH